MSEVRLFPVGTVPECSTPDWYADREAAPHLEQEGHRERLLKTYDFCLMGAALGASTACDLGAGDGGLLSLLQDDFDVAWGYDLQPLNVEAAFARGANVVIGDVTENVWTAGELTIACEILEHLVDPHALVREIHERGVKCLVASSPYTETKDHHYEHHLWAWDEEGYQKMLTDAGWTVLQTARAWICQVVLCVR